MTSSLSDRASFEVFYAEHRGSIGRALAVTLRDDHLASEALDEAMLRAYQRWAEVRHLESPSGWVYTVGLNWSRSALRRMSRSRRVGVNDPLMGSNQLADPDLDGALRALTVDQRAVVVCRYLIGYSEAETARVLSIRPGTVKSRLHRALNQLHSLLKDREISKRRQHRERNMTDSDRSSPVDEQEADRLHRHLADHARSANLSSTLSSTIVQRAERRTRRRRSVSLIGAAAMVIGGVAISAIVVRTGDRPSGRVVPADSVSTTEPSTTEPSTSVLSTIAPTPTTTASTVVQRAPLAWKGNDLGTDSLVSNLYQTFTGTGPLYAWTIVEQASGDFISNLYRSDDGITWQPIAETPGLAVVAATAASTRIAVLGYIPSLDATGPNDIVVRLSDDDGSSWQTIPLPLQIPAPQPGGKRVRPTSATIAFNGNTLVAAIGLEPAPHPGVPTTSDASGDTGAIAPQVYVSANGKPFEAVADGPIVEASVSRSIAVAESDGEFLALSPGPANGGDAPRSTFWRSIDGRIWTALGTVPAQDSYAATIGKVGNTYALATVDGGFWLSADGANWQPSNLSGLLESAAQQGQLLPYAAVIGPTGITLVGMLPITNGNVYITKAGVTEQLHGGSLSDISFYDEATGAELGHVTTSPFDNGVVRSLGDGKIDILDTNGNVRATFTVEEVAQASNASANQSAAQEVILHSDDGLTWSSASINQLTGGQPSDVAWIRSTAAATTIGVWVEAGGDSTTPNRHLHVLTANTTP